ncbi:averantin oxidoreductase [Microthyrium microscopicum]|uniref:Averantin oxidoreductase n=1 Tax=Microthyrium microscopicum TaxID=703497 RepID=A0A6A6U358_9PEZI|nr:averantin oxidoreductase [Microthyrium microscopicum]
MEFLRNDSGGLSYGSLAVVVAGIVILQQVGTLIYRVFFHPLAKYPGPFLNSISALPAALSLLRGRFPFDNKIHHEKYGPVFRLSPNELVFSSAQATQDIYGFRPGHQNMKKSPLHTGPVKVGSTTTLQYVDSDADHARQRKALSHSFSQHALMEQEPIVKDYMDKVIFNLRRLATSQETFNICDWFNYFTFDTMGDLAFGEPFGCLDNGTYQEWVHMLFYAVQDGARIQATRRIAGVNTVLQRALQFCIKDLGKGGAYHVEHTRRKVLARLERGQETKHRDFIWYILRQNEKYELKTDEIIANSGLFITAGSETTASALAGLIARLVWNPSCYQKLVTEIREAFPTEDSITFKALNGMTYLNACIEEILRVHPPVPAGPPRAVPPGGDTVDGIWVPGGTTVSVGQWSSCHDPANFKRPDEFLPERWIDAEFDSDNKKAVQPFSVGPRNCIGRNLAYMEMRVMIARLFWNFDVLSVDGAPLWNPKGDLMYKTAFMVWERSIIMVKLKDLRR